MKSSSFQICHLEFTVHLPVFISRQHKITGSVETYIFNGVTDNMEVGGPPSIICLTNYSLHFACFIEFVSNQRAMAALDGHGARTRITEDTIVGDSKGLTGRTRNGPGVDG